MGFYQAQVVPRLVELACRSASLGEWRARACAGMAGRVVEIGFGSGLNVAHYPRDVAAVLAVEPAAVARRRSAARVARSTVPVTHVGQEARDLPLADGSCDAALCTFTLCTIPDPARALAELYRVLRPGGRLHFVEHGLAPDPAVAAWQHRIDPLQRRVAAGCHLTRQPVALLSAAGFRLDQVEQRYARGPRPWSFLSAGQAVRPESPSPARGCTSHLDV